MAHLTIYRRASVSAAALGLVLALASGCNWTEFDDLENDTWVTSTGKPNEVSTNLGVAIQRGSMSSASDGGGKLIVIGDAQLQYIELAYSSAGESSVVSASMIDDAFVGTQPILLADPKKDDVSLLATTAAAGGQVHVLNRSGSELTRHPVGVSGEADAATYLVRDETQTAQMLVAVANSVYGVSLTIPPASPPAACPLAPSGVTIRALGAARTAATTDEMITWTSDGLLSRFSKPEASSCPTPATAMSTFPTGFNPEKGSQIIMIDDGKYALLVGRNGTNGFLGLFDVTPPLMAPVGMPIEIAGVGTASILTLGPNRRFVVAGYPGDVVDGVTAGQVRVFPLLTTTVGIDPIAVMTLHDAEPEASQRFGRSVAVMQLDGRQVIAVAADNEIFVYHKAALYEEMRLGR